MHLENLWLNLSNIRLKITEEDLILNKNEGLYFLKLVKDENLIYSFQS